MTVIALPLLVCILGLLLYALVPPADGKLAEIGRIMFAFGLLAFLLVAAPQTVHLLTR